jgi:hypothetical protein
MATVQSVINSCRYDIQDYETGLMFDDAELLNYLNRMIGVLDSELAMLNSDLVEGEEADIDTVQDQNYVDISSMNSGDWDSIRQVWIGSDIVEKIPLDNMRYKRMYRTGTGKPYYWCLYNRQLLFEHDCDQAYTDLTIYYNKKTAELALDDSMPFNDIFNESIREMLTLYAAARKEGAVGGVNAAMQGLFKKRAMEEVIRRGFVPKPYYIDF